MDELYDDETYNVSEVNTGTIIGQQVEQILTLDRCLSTQDLNFDDQRNLLFERESIISRVLQRRAVTLDCIIKKLHLVPRGFDQEADAIVQSVTEDLLHLKS